MPTQPKTHDDFRKIVCLLCCEKGKSTRKISAVLLDKIKDIRGFENYDSSNEKFPVACCGRCYNIINR